MKRLFKVLPLFFLFALAITKSFGQFVDETDCSDGMDDGGDGFIDCYDMDCHGNNSCTSFFFGNNVVCSDDPNITDFQVGLQWASNDQTANSHASPIIGDLDQDGIPEVVVNNKHARTVTILNGEDGSIYRQLNLGWGPENVMAMANVLRNDCAYIFVYEDAGNNMVMLDCDLNTIWSARQNEIGNPAFADFNQDGVAELYHRNEIRNATNGTILVDGFNQRLNPSVTWSEEVISASVAIDFFDQNEVVNGIPCTDCQGLELAAGRYIYSVNINTGILTPIKDINDDIGINPQRRNRYFIKTRNPSAGVSVADYNQDGNMDILMSGALGTSQGAQTTIFFWDITNSTVDTYADVGNNHDKGTGRLNIADLDGDGQLNVNYVSNRLLYSLDENMNLLWSRIIEEGSSGFTGMTLFDFDDDGTVETVYRSESQLFIIDGVDGSDRITPINCVSRTQEEYPVVADVDGDGASEICVTCYTNDATSFEPYFNTLFSQVRVYEAGGKEVWQPSRSVWNQSSYFVVNINDDLTVPIQQQDHSVVFSNGVCTTGDHRVLNSFMVQSPLLNEAGCPSHVTPDLNLGSTISATNSLCPNVDFDVTFNIGNTGDLAVSGSVPVTFYAGDPFVAGSVQLNTVIVTLTNLDLRQTVQFTETVNGSGGDFELFIVINDAGGTPPISFSPASILECGDETNNVHSIDVVSDPFTLTLEKVNDNRKCLPAGAGLPDNGEAKAYYDGSLTSQSTLYSETFDDLTINDTFDNGTSTTPPSSWSRVVASLTDFAKVVNNNANNMFGVGDTDGTVTWSSGTINIAGFTDVSIRADMFAEGSMETSGSGKDMMEVKYSIDGGAFTFLNQGNGVANFGYQQATIAGLSGSDIVVQVEFDTDQNDEKYYLDNVNVSGLSSTTKQFTEADGFVFEWYDATDIGLTTILHSGSTYPTMADGNYLLQGYYSLANCFSDILPVTIDLNPTPSFFAHAYEVSPLKDCDILDGEVTAFAYTFEDSPGVPGDTLTTGYTFTWTFTTGGVTTLGAAPTLSNLDANQYRVTIQENLTGCTTSFDVDVTTTLVDPGDIEIVATYADIAVCNGTGEISAFVDDDSGAGVTPNTTDYTFEWYNGTQVKATPDFIGITYTGLMAGDYLVRAIKTATSCPSLGILVEILDNSVASTPSITNLVHNTTCDTNANGSASIDGDGAGTTSGYTFVWYLGDNTLSTNELPAALTGSSTGAGDFEMTGLIASKYRVVITETVTNCTSEIQLEIAQNTVTPVIDRVNVNLTNNSSCDASAPNGILDASGAVTPSNTYTYRLYQGFTLVTELDNNSTGIFSGLANGDYTITAENDASKCLSSLESFSIGITPNNPVITTTVVDDTNCDGSATFSGEIGVTSSSPANTSTYKYELFDGANFSTSLNIQTNIDGATGHTFTGLKDGTYRVQVTDTLLCHSFVDILIGDVAVAPTFTSGSPSEINNTSCLASNGGITVQIDGDLGSNYDFAWYDGEVVGVGLRLGDVTNSISGLSAGKYTVVATHKTTNCTTGQITGEIFDLPIFPNITIENVLAQTDCGSGDGGSANAYVSASGCDPCIEADGFTFQWYIGSGTGGTQVSTRQGGDNSSVTGLTAGTYTVEVTDPLGCDNTKEMTIGLSQINPVLAQDGAATDNTSCTVGAYNGAVTVKVEFDGEDPVVDLTGYTFTWYTGSGDSKTLNASSTSETLSGIQGGVYSVEVQAPNSCASGLIIVNVDDNIPVVAVTESLNIDNTICVQDGIGGNPDNNGSVTLTPDTSNPVSIPAGGYNFALETSSGTTINNAGGTPNYEDVTYATNASVALILGLPAGNYVMVVTNANNNCPVDHPFTISNGTDDPIIDQAALTISATTSPNTVCAAPFTGSATAAISGGSGDYTYKWALAATPATTIDTDATLSAVDAGNYILVVTDNITGCTSATANAIITNNIPVITIDTNEDQSDFGCSGTNTGQLTAAINGIPGSTGYDLTWYRGTSATGVPIATTTDADNTISNLNAGWYIVEVLNNTTGCTETETIEVTSQALTLTPNLSSTDQQSCNLEDGTATVTSVNVAGGPTGHSPIYKYDWYLGTSQLIEIPFDNLLGTFEEGEAINIGTESAIIVVYDAGGTILASNPTGDITDNDAITGASSGATASANSSEDITTSGTVGVSTLNYLTAGTYSVIVTDTQSGCTAVRADIAVTDATGAPTISFTNVNIPNSCDAAGGSINGVVAGGGPYTYRWYEGSDDFTNDDDYSGALANGDTLLADEDNNLITVNNTAPALGNLISGLYTLVVESANGCKSQATYDLPYNGIQTTTTLTITNVTQCPDNGQANVELSDNLVVTVDNSGPRVTTLTVLETFTAMPSGATGIISNDDGTTTLQLSVTSGTIGATDVITGDISGNSATVDGVAPTVGHVSGETDDISEYIIYLFAGNGVPANRTASYTITNSVGATLTFPYKYNPRNGDVLDGDDSLIDNNGIVTAGSPVRFDDLPSGPYTAIAQENPTIPGVPDPTTNFGSSSQCWTTSATEILLQEAYAPILTAFDVVDDSFCDSDNGSLSVTVTEHPDDDYLRNGFTFDWWNTNGTVALGDDTNFFSETISSNTNLVANGYSATSITPATLAAGDYYAQITRHNSTTTTDIGCLITSPIYTVSAAPEVHEILTVDVTHNSDCDPFNSEIQITAINDAGTASVAFNNYLFKWYLANQTTQIVYVPYAALAGGNFENGDVLFFAGGALATVISDNDVDGLIASYTSGTIAIAEAFNNGGGVNATTSLGNPIDNTGSIGDNDFTGLENGTYYITIDDQTASGCPTTLAFYEVTIQDDTVDPTLRVVQTSPDESCDDVTFTPSGVATATPNVGVVNDYLFTWYQNDQTTLLDAAPVNATIAGGNGTIGANIASTLPENPAGESYYVQITDINATGNNLGCQSILEAVTITQFEPNYSLQSATADFTTANATDCDPANGEFLITAVTESDPGGGNTRNATLTDYTFQWFQNGTQIYPIPTNAIAGTFQIGELLTINGTAAAATVVGVNPTNQYLIVSGLILDVANTNTIVGATSAANTTANLTNNVTTTVSVGNALAYGLPAEDYTVIINSAINGCPTAVDSQITTFTIQDNAVDPSVELDNKTASTFCNNTNPNDGDGTLNVNIIEGGINQDPPVNYTVTWFRGNSTAGVDEIFPLDGGSRGTASENVDLTELTGLSQGFYTVTIEKTTGGSPGFGCTYETAFEIIQAMDIPTLDDAAINLAKINNSNCAPGFNGSITINDTDVSTGDLTDFTIIIEKTSVGSGDIRFGPATPAVASIVASNLEAGEYFISAENTTTGCDASTIRVNIDDINFPPDIQLVSLINNLNCAGGTDMIGSITVTADGFDESNANYQFQWHTGSGTGSPIVGETNASLSGRGANIYTVRVNDVNTECSSTQEFTISDVDDDPIITSYTVVDPAFCTSNGSFTLSGVEQTGATLNAVAMDTEGYTLQVFKASNNVSQGTATTSPYEITGLVIDSYYAVVTNDDSNCPSDPISFDIKDAIVYPLIGLAMTNNDPCSIAANGGIVATADGMDDTDPDYTFNWYFYDNGTMTRGPLIANASSISSQEGGFYELEVSYTPSGCTVSTVAEIIDNDPISPEIDVVIATGTTQCTSPNGSITVTSINQDTPQDYLFDLYNVDPNGPGVVAVSSLPAGSNPITFSALTSGDYWLIVTHNASGCVSATPEHVTVEDLSTPPVIDFTTFEPNTRCDPTISNGSLTTEADGSMSTDPLTGYTWAWTGSDQSGNLVRALPNAAEITGIPAGTYNLTVTNNATGCSTVADPYILTDESPTPLNISVSTSGNTNCVNFNGKMAATVIQPNYPLDEYDYLWFIGTQNNPDLDNPDFIGSLIEDLANGSYTLVVRDVPGINDICQSAVIPVLIEDDRGVNFVPTVELVSDVTYCYENLSNGHAQVTNDDLGQYKIEWFKGIFDPATVGTAIRTGFYVDSLVVGNYHTKMTNLISGCEYTTDFTIIDATETVTSPNVILIASNTHCTNPNGEAVATVNGSTQSILFEWFDADDLGFSTVLFSGSRQHSLGENDADKSYIVRATNLITGCVSATSSVTVEFVITNPTFEVVTANSLCLRTEDGAINQFNGEAFIKFSSFNFVETATWTDKEGKVLTHSTTGVPITQSGVGGLAPGDYTVSFVANNGCTYDVAFNINTALQVFNFVTANGDTRNDFFFIDCLDFYPNNNVKIFTRGGQRVFEKDAYDNFTNRFDGTSDKGKPLPSGTYFYIIDRGDGSELVQGYLELVR